jgi:predicted extracellular nuclease
MKMSRFVGLVAVIVVMACNTAGAAIRITEWMYQGNPDENIVAPEAGEFVELTNVGNTPIDMTGWYFVDSTPAAGSLDLSAFGVVQPGESVVWTDWNVTLFKNAWGLGPEVDVIGGSEIGLGRSDTINIYNANDTLVDTLQYSDQTFPGSPRTRQISANIPFESLGLNNPISAVSSANGDVFGSYTNTRLEVGNPGVYTQLNAIPEPTTFVLVAAACGALMACRRR